MGGWARIGKPAHFPAAAEGRHRRGMDSLSGPRFATTRWSLVAEAGGEDPAAADALESLCGCVLAAAVRVPASPRAAARRRRKTSCRGF